MIKREHNGIVTYHYEIFEKSGVAHFISTRLGGVSSGGYDSLNLGLHTDDSRECVVENRQRVADAIGEAPESFVIPEQIHSCEVVVVDEQNRYCGFYERSDSLPDCDGLITDVAQKVLAISGADCIPILIASRDGKVVSALHSGWKGTYGNILHNALVLFLERYEVAKEEILVGIGPAICGACYEVDRALFEKFQQRYLQYRDSFKEKKGKFLLNLQNIVYNHAISFGVEPHNIEIASYCTKCDNELFYSYRVNEKCGRFWSGIYIKERG